VHGEPRVEDAELGADDASNLRWIWVELRRARRNRHHDMNQKVARWDVRGIERPDNGDAVLRIISIKAELLVELADRRLLRRLTRLHLPAREGELPAVRSPLRALDQEYLAVEWVRLKARPIPALAAASERNRWDQ
jgi:hypothetical protein